MGGWVEGLITPANSNTICRHLSASLAVIVWKVADQHLFLNIIPSNFTVGTRWKVCCDKGMREMGSSLQHMSRITRLRLCNLNKWSGHKDERPIRQLCILNKIVYNCEPWELCPSYVTKLLGSFKILDASKGATCFFVALRFEWVDIS